MDRWQKPKIEIATKYKDDDLAYATYGMAQAALVLHKLDLPPSEFKKISEPWEWEVYAGELLTVEPEVHNPPYGGWISGGG